jgi:hypothetical protein
MLLTTEQRAAAAEALNDMKADGITIEAESVWNTEDPLIPFVNVKAKN